MGIRTEEALLAAGKAYNKSGAAIAAVENSGQNGYARNMARLANSTPYSQQQMCAILTRPPKMFELHPDRDRLVAALKVFVEEWPTQIEGINLQIQSDQNSTAQGNDRQTLRTPGGAYLNEQTVTWTGQEGYAKAWSKFWDYVYRTFISDPVTGSPNIEELNSAPTDHMLDQYSFDVLFYEPCPLKQEVVSACCAVGCWPQVLPENSMRKNITEGQPNKEITVETPCIVDTSSGFTAMAQEILDAQNQLGINPNELKAFQTEIDGDVQAADVGLLAGAKALKG